MGNSTPIPAPWPEYWRQLRKPLELELARGCPDTAIAGMGIGGYAHAWAERGQRGDAEAGHFALTLARGLRDYRTMPVAERRRRAMAAIALLREREELGTAPPPQTPPRRR